MELDDDEILWITFTLIIGGAENPAAMIGNSLLYLSQDADLRARLVADHRLIPAACEELPRHTSSAVSLARTATQDVELEGLADDARHDQQRREVTKPHEPSL